MRQNVEHISLQGLRCSFTTLAKHIKNKLAKVIKTRYWTVDKATENLLRLNNKMNTKAAFLSVITAAGRVVHTRDDGVSVIPIDLLGP